MILKKITAADITVKQNDIILVTALRNELSRLPYWFHYYRDMGITHFLIVDDYSTDGSTDFMQAQNDCWLFNPTNTYAESNSATDWQNELLELYGTGHWTLVADADELLVYPDSENTKLPAFCAKLDEQKSDALYCFLLDMYPDTDLSRAICEPGKPFYEICSYFDKDYQLVERFSLFSNKALAFPPKEAIGGPRLRTFYPEQKDTGLVNRLKNRLIWKACNLLEKLGVKFTDKPHNAPTLFKVPLVKWKKGYARLSGHHFSSNIEKLSPTTGALLHFKFFADFHDKAKLESTRGQHYAGGQEYKRYLRYIAQNPDISFRYEGSVKYESTQTLLQHGLITA